MENENKYRILITDEETGEVVDDYSVERFGLIADDGEGLTIQVQGTFDDGDQLDFIDACESLLNGITGDDEEQDDE